MKRIVIVIFALAFAAVSEAATVTNFVGSIATRQFIMGIVSPQVAPSWTWEILADNAGSGTSQMPDCSTIVSNWLAASTTQPIPSNTEHPFLVNGAEGKVVLAKDGFRLGALDNYSAANITQEYLTPSYNGSSFRWRYRYYSSYSGEERDFRITLELRPVWAWE